MKVKFLKSPSGAPAYLGYFPGDIVDLEDALAKDLIDQGVAVLASSNPSETAEKATSKQAASAETR